ncbi:hypothetical protein BB934_35580 (plasmid) [Microvirga ossetica]|uniref:Uncharacterized protein n=1 Tax=Microvirga ossetica TaxID=1882682 RepID=A0A1B2EUE1_9HYPH|nr:hypothetical protein [Microvirga ossetica]ANY83580.1 hypothetical protein BB934_35580 [Microvirga ossetica]
MVTQPICLADLVSLAELGEAFTALERARRHRRIARNRVMTIREALDHVLDEAFRRQSFAPLEHLFRREEMALEDYDETVWQMARAEQRWGAVLLALAQECDLMRAGPPTDRRVN